MTRRQVVLAVDVGTTKAAALVAEARLDGDTAVLGIAGTPIMGVKRGMVLEPERAAQSIRDAVNRAVSMAGVDPVEVVAAVNGDHVRAQMAEVSADLKGRSIHHADVEAIAARMAKDTTEAGRDVVRVIRGWYSLDGLPSSGSPVGLSVHQLTARGWVVSAQTQVLRNLRRTLQLAGLTQIHWVPAGLAASVASLSEDERQLGVVMLDVGGGTTQVMVWQNGLPRLLAVIPVGGDLVTSDIAVGLGVVAGQAERLKVERGHAAQDASGMVELKSVSGQAVKLVPLNEVAEIVNARVTEWMDMVETALAQISWAKGPPGGVVMTGGGAQLKGLQARIQKAWGWPVRMGTPLGLAGLSDLTRSPGHAVVVGAAKLALQDGFGFRRDTIWTRIAQSWLRTWS